MRQHFIQSQCVQVSRRVSRRRSTLFAGAASLVLAAPSFAQTAAAPEEDIIVTGSRVARSGADTPTPVTVIGMDDFNRVAAPDIANVINQMPAARPSLTPSSSGNLFSLAASNFIDLRGLGYQRTQVLVDGRRYTPTTASGGVNISAIPQALVRGVEIVTGGASAAYGSDAVAGVVNILIDDKLEGLKANMQGGISGHNDFKNFLISGAYGTSFAGGRGHIVVSGEASQNTGIEFIGDRDWAARNPGIIANPAYTATNSEPRYLLVHEGARASNASYGGVINSPGLLRGIQFAPDGTPIPFIYGENVTATQMQGGSGTANVADSVGTVPVNRYAGFGRIRYELTDSVEAFAEFNYTHVNSHYMGLASTEQLTIRADNAFLPQSIRDTMAANNIASFVMGRSVLDNARNGVDISVNTLQAVAGFKGEVFSTWKWDAYYSYGSTKNRVEQPNSRITARFNQALDAVVNPLNGAIVCRSTLTNPTNGCVPINLIGEGRASPDAIAWTNGTGFRQWDIDQHIVAASLRGELFSTWAGPVGVAVGAEYRSQSLDTTSDPISAVQGYRGGGTVPYSGNVNVKEAFAEALVPLAVDESWAKDLSLNLAGRVTDYSTSGTVTTWKIGVNYAVNDSLRFRATRSRDIRAPSLEELFAKGSTSQLSVSDPQLGMDYLVTAANSGNPDLTPEKADTFTGGIVLTPTAVPGLSFTVDYYDIRLNDAIISLTPAAIVTQCYGTAPSACSLITRDPGTGMITRVRNGPVNMQSVKLAGVDIEASYAIPVGSDQIALRALVNYISKAEISDGITTTTLAGSVDQPTIAALGGSPNWRFNTSASYIAEKFRLSLTGRYMGGGAINKNYTDKDLLDNKVNGRLYFDLSGEYTLIDNGDGQALTIFGAVQNLLDTDPPITGVGGYGTTRALYDVIGRQFTLGARFKF
ncbi:MAG: TonB-dependent receptor [Sphingomonas sp.]|nr:MAG: TonB-dependent receptor [Sphingomonas sp.]